MEDLVGTVEVVVFPRQFEKSRMLMEEGQRRFCVKARQTREEGSAGKKFWLTSHRYLFDQVPSAL
ncbi:MAG: hypothetical protein ACLRR3_03905 [Eubacterium sp.]